MPYVVVTLKRFEILGKTWLSFKSFKHVLLLRSLVQMANQICLLICLSSLALDRGRNACFSQCRQVLRTAVCFMWDKHTLLDRVQLGIHCSCCIFPSRAAAHPVSSWSLLTHHFFHSTFQNVLKLCVI